MYGLVGANQKIPANAWVAIVGGYWVNITSTTGLEGRVAKCLKDVDNTGGANGAASIDVQLPGGRELVLIANDTTSPITLTDLGGDAYWLDNATITVDSGLLTAVVARLVELKADLNAHAAGTGAYHGSADGAAPYTITTATNLATGITAAGELITAAKAHVAKVSGSPAIHGAADAAALGALATLGAPTDLASLAAFAQSFSSIMFGVNGHTVRTTVHGAADATNVLTSAAPIATRSRAGRAWAFYKAAMSAADETRVWVEVQ